MKTQNFFSEAPVSKEHYYIMCIVATYGAFNAAERVLNHDPQTTQEDVEVATANQLVTYEIDIDGYYPRPTWLYIVLQEWMYGVVEDD